MKEILILLMAKRVTEHEGLSLKDLEISPGELFGIDTLDPDWPQPLILGIFDSMTKYEGDSQAPRASNVLRVSFYPQSGIDNRELWDVTIRGKMMEVWGVRKDGVTGVTTPEFDLRLPSERYGVYHRLAEDVMSGKQAVMEYLDSRREFQYFAEALRNGKLSTQRGKFDGLIERLGLGSVLPNQLRLSA
jgi:hypothetical protein